MAPEKRSELVAVRLTKAETAMLRELAEADGLYQSDVLRLLVRRAYAERFGEKPKPKRTKKPRPVRKHRPGPEQRSRNSHVP